MCFAGNFFVIEKFQAMKTTIYVSDSNTIGPWNGTQNYPLKTVQEGITAANAGDTVLVLSGTYNENLGIMKDLSITDDSKDTTFIDGGESGLVVNAHGAFESNIYIFIKNFTILNIGGEGFDCITFSYITNSKIFNKKILNSRGLIL
jgi:hypothetical protein